MGQQMSHCGVYDARMISSRRSHHCRVPIALSWSHQGISYRLSPWPEVRLERKYGAEWITAALDPEALRQAQHDPSAWRSYAEFVPAPIRELLGCFRANRLIAVHVAARCPELASALIELPALVPFIAQHGALRGDARWSELTAVFDRAGVFGIMEWLGLPATRDALTILRDVITPDVPEALLGPLRVVLWKPEGVFALARRSAMSEWELMQTCHALAA
jgi:hypothetical protein